MRNKRLVIAGATMLAASLAFSACGQRSTSGENTGGNTETKTAKIGVIAPLSGDLSALGLGIRNSVDLAIKQANESNAIPGWKLEVAAEDDEAKPDVGKNAATKLAGDDDVIGVVGTLNSSVAQSVQPVLAAPTSRRFRPPTPEPHLTQGARSGGQVAPVQDLLPDVHHRRHPGPLRRALPLHDSGHQEGRDHPRQEDLRCGPRRRFHRRVQESRRRGCRGGNHQPGRQGLRLGHHEG